MNYIDLILVAIVAFLIWTDYRRGFILSALMLLTWIGSLVIAFLAYAPLSSILLRLAPSLNYWADPLSFLIALIVSRLILELLSSDIVQRVPLKTHRHMLNKILGVIPGMVNALIWAALVASMFLLMPLTKISTETHESKFSEVLVSKISWLQNELSPVFSEALNKIARKTTIESSNEETIKLPFTTKNNKTRPDLAAEMLVLINKERTQRGLNTLKADAELAAVALQHSGDMLARGYFSHYTPEGLSPFDRINKAKVRFITAGENLALAPNLDQAHTGLMNSPGHRANILNRGFGRVGIGILDAGIRGLMITQNFRN
ncbi:MAG: CvpA family protein [Arcticibacter sp.]